MIKIFLIFSEQTDPAFTLFFLCVESVTNVSLGSYSFVSSHAMGIIVKSANRSWLTTRVDGRYDVLDGEVILSYTNG